ncbi:MAG: hypothetical protein M1817_001736 [Caeruleum heppii]|nr:MAG: hypothetical protein M1817_001736 [Caeruleum heppii]
MPFLKTKSTDDEKVAKDRDRLKDKERSRPSSGASRTHKKSLSSPDPKRSSPNGSATRRKKKRDVVPELRRRESPTAESGPSDSKTSLPYPSFSKAHSKEAVGREASAEPITPDPTDLGEVQDVKARIDGGGTKSSRTTRARDQMDGMAPPSPPLTATTPPVGRPTPHAGVVETAQETPSSRSSNTRGTRRVRVDSRPHSMLSRSSRRKSKEATIAASSTLSASASETDLTRDKQSTVSSHTTDHTSRMSKGSRRSRGTESTLDSDATSVARGPTPRTAHPAPVAVVTADDSSPETNDDSSVQTPTHPSSPWIPSVEAERKPPSGPTLFADLLAGHNPRDSPQPPPPPPPPVMPVAVPRVDYLLQNGGLPHSVPRTLLAAGQPLHTTQQSTGAPPYGSPRVPNLVAAEIDRIFAPYHGLLDQYDTVIRKSGSLAVATGYKSVARRLLDRLENVFARNISCEVCRCPLCQRDHPDDRRDTGLSWGEVLEWVCGRREIPIWPAFDFSTLGDPVRSLEQNMGLGITSSDKGHRPTSPIPVDADVPEEFRDHYIRQSKKTKQVVDRWLTSQPANPSSPPPEVDDETLTFSILTHLSRDERPLLNALLAVSPRPSAPDSRAPTPMTKPRSELLGRTAVALQRLYRLSSLPRDPEVAIFLLKHPLLHDLLATLSAINPSEWDVLTSGRFDGFLWSGAEDPAHPSPQISRGPTPLSRGPSAMSQHRNGTPFSSMGPGGLPYRTPTPFHNLASAASRGTTPAPGHPVPHDEETEVAVLAEIEREIYQGMEVLEDAFEALHRRAEDVRRALRERGAGLSLAGQARQQTVEVVSGTPGPPGSAFGFRGDGIGGEWESESEAGWANDGASELWPDDSASNISSSRVRRPKRRNERRTPALVEEESEDGE